MPGKLAKQLCPDAIFVRGDMELYSRYSKDVTSIISERAPVVEKASIDEHYLDITGMDRFFGCEKWAKELRATIVKETGLPISFGLSVNKTVSKVATGQGKPNGEKIIPRGVERNFLAPLSVKKIPMVGDKTYLLLRNMGVEKVQTVQEMPIRMMQNTFGENGVMIWKKCNAIDDTPIEPYTEQKSLSTETTFDRDTTDVALLRETLIVMVDSLCFDLRRQKRITGCVTLKLRYSDFQTHTFQAKIAYTANDHTILKKVLELFQKNYSRRVLIRLIGIRFSHLVSGFNQINLFEDTLEMVQLYQAMDKIRNRFGAKALMRAVGVKKEG
jgi:DNA polymerase-4